MNKKELLHHLKHDRNIEVSEKKLRSVLKRIGLQSLRQYTTEEVEKVVFALSIIDEFGGTEEGYRAAASKLGLSGGGGSGGNGSYNHSHSGDPSASSDRHENLNDFINEKVRHYVGGVVSQKAREFLSSPESFEYFADIVTEELVGAFGNSFDSWAEEDLRAMKNVTPHQHTINIDAERHNQGGLPGASSGSDDDSDGADFHNYTNNNNQPEGEGEGGDNQ